MAVLIPENIADSRLAVDGDACVGQALQASLSEDAWVWYNPPASSHRPRFVVLSPQFGVVGVDVCNWLPNAIQEAGRGGIRLTDGNLCNPANELGKRLEELRARLSGMQPELPLQGLLAMPHLTNGEAKAKGLDRALPRDLLVTRDRFSSDGFAQSLTACSSRLSPDVFNEARERLYPDTSFERLRVVCNEGQAERVAMRVRLSAEQESLACNLNSGVTLVRGVAGSGKSLVLAARARHLAGTHPDWRILILCFNHALTTYLADLVGTGHPNVEVATFHRWTHHSLSLWLPWKDDEESLVKEHNRVAEAIREGRYKHLYDAVLVDEGQDFRPTWYYLIRHVLTPDRGGLLVVMDGAQSIYREVAVNEVFGGQVAELSLKRNYRNTEQIGRFALEAIFGHRPLGDGRPGDSRRPVAGEFVSSGEPVQVVWAQNPDDQAAFITAAIRRLVRDGHAAYRNIAVLFPRWAGAANRLADALGRGRVPVFRLDRSQEARAAFDLEENTVKLLTVHAAKGLEFPVVFLFGAEAIELPQTVETASAAEANWARVLYVGMTRATDLLYLTYTRLKGAVERATSLKAWGEFRSYPDDFDF